MKSIYYLKPPTKDNKEDIVLPSPHGPLSKEVPPEYVRDLRVKGTGINTAVVIACAPAQRCQLVITNQFNRWMGEVPYIN